MAMPQGLVGMLQGKNFVKPPKAKKSAVPKDAIARRLAAKEDVKDGGKDDAKENPFGMLKK